MQAISELSAKLDAADRRYPFYQELTRLQYGKTEISDSVYIQDDTTQRTKAMKIRLLRLWPRCMQEDLTMKAVNDSENRQTLALRYG